MTNLTRWEFSPSGGDYVGFNEGAIDIFQGLGLRSLVREIVQNSADAHDGGENPVRIVFSMHTVAASEAPEFTTLGKWLERAWANQPRKASDDELANKRHDFYEIALHSLNSKTIPVIGIHDFNTTGLTGPTTFSGGQSAGPWWALVRSTGSNVKAKAGAGGSFGHGSKAPFAFSGLRTVFYFTQFAEGDDWTTRFQGKSILESMPVDSNPSLFTSNTGHFGDTTEAQNVQPLTGSQVPEWARSGRHQFGTGSGTSVYIPFPQFDDVETFWNDTRRAVTGNFAAAVKEGTVEIELAGEETINSSTIRQLFNSLDRTGLSDSEKAGLESAETVLFGLRGKTTWDGFGEIEYFTRKGEGLSHRKVGIARAPGMLVTRDAEGLKMNFASTEPFDLFLWVRGDEGNTFLQSLENPEHDRFQFDTFFDKEKKKAAVAKYGIFRTNVRALVSELFGVTVEDRISLGDLDFLLQGLDGGDGAPSDNGESDIPEITKVQRPTSPAGGSQNKKKGSPKNTKKGKKPPRGTGGVLDAGPNAVDAGEILADGLRVIPKSGHPSRATVIIDTPAPEYRFLEIYRAGETVVADEPCRIKVFGAGGGPVTRIPLTPNGKNDRLEITVEFEDNSDLHGRSRLVGVLR